MNTATQKKAAAVQPRKAVKKAVTEQAGLKEEGAFDRMDLSVIDICPINYRKYFNAQALADFAVQIGFHGVISPVTVRPMPTGRYELVTGERRYRASALAGLTSIPAMIRNLTDEQVMEMQLSENLHREDPHPLHESFAIARMQNTGMSIEEIAARLGKSKTFVYTRIKLSALIEVVQDIFLGDRITAQEAYDIAALSPASQYEFYEEYCTEWQEEGFKLGNLRYLLNRYKYDLTNAPFNTKDKKLLPEAGACTSCPFNSATLKTLFPEMAKKATCSGHACYQQKCAAHLKKTIEQAVKQHQPEAILYRGSLPDDVRAIIGQLDEIKELPQFGLNEVTLLSVPDMPDQDDFEYGDDGIGTEAYEQALQEYHADIEQYETLQISGIAKRGLQLGTQDLQVVLFSPERNRKSSEPVPSVTAKAVQEAIKEGTVTAELLDGEMVRLQEREKRAKELDTEKVQVKLHEQYVAEFGTPVEGQTLTAADQIAARLIIYQSLDYSARYGLHEQLFPSISEQQTDGATALFSALAGLNDTQFSFLIRKAVASKSDSKLPGNVNALALYQTGKAGGMDVESIEQAQQEIAIVRQEKLEDRLADLARRKEKLRV